MQIIRIPSCKMSYILQIRNVSAPKELDHEVEIDDLANMRKIDGCVLRFSYFVF